MKFRPGINLSFVAGLKAYTRGLSNTLVYRTLLFVFTILFLCGQSTGDYPSDPLEIPDKNIQGQFSKYTSSFQENKFQKSVLGDFSEDSLTGDFAEVSPAVDTVTGDYSENIIAQGITANGTIAKNIMAKNTNEHQKPAHVVQVSDSKNLDKNIKTITRPKTITAPTPVTQQTILKKENTENKLLDGDSPTPATNNQEEKTVKENTPSSENDKQFAAVQSNLEKLNEEKEETLFDVYVSDVFNCTALVRYQYDGSYFEILEPDDLISQLKNLNLAPEIKPLLIGAKVRKQEIPEIGKIEFDEQTFRVVLNLKPKFLKTKKFNDGDLITSISNPADEYFSMRNDFKILDSFSSKNGEGDPILGHQNYLNFGRDWLYSNGNYQDQDGYTLDELSLNFLINRFKLTGGFTKNIGQKFVGGGNFFGLKFENINDIIVGDERLRGSSLEVFIPSRATVRFYRGTNLISTQQLEFGLQEINTTSFPQGGYDLIIEILEENGNVTRQRKYFTSSGLLASRGFPAYSLNLGVLRDNYTILDSSFAQFSTAHRVLSFLQLESGVSILDDQSTGRIGFLGLYGETIFGAGYALSNNSNSGLSAQLSSTYRGFNFGLDYNVTSGDFKDESTIGDDQFQIIPQSQTEKIKDQFRSLTEKRGDFSAYLFKAFGKFEFRLSGEKAVLSEDKNRYSYGGSVLWRIANSFTNSTTLQTAYNFTDRGEEFRILFSYQKRWGFWTGDFQSNLSNSQGESKVMARPSIFYQDLDRVGLGTFARLTTENSFDKADYNLFDNTTLETTLNRKLVRIESRLQHTGFSKDENEALVGLGASTSLLFDNKLSPTLSFPPQGEGIFIADIVSNNSTAKIKIFIDRVHYTSVTSGERTAFGLAPYRKYKISIRPAKAEDSLRYDAEEYDIVPTPGKVIRKTWNVEKVFVAIGRIVNAEGKPLVNVTVKGIPDTVVTDEEGGFQAELVGNEKLFVKNSRVDCKIDKSFNSDPAVEEQPLVRDFGDLICK